MYVVAIYEVHIMRIIANNQVYQNV